MIEIKLHVEVNKRGLKIKIGDKLFTSSDLEDNTSRSTIFRTSKKLQYIYLEDMVFRMNLSYNEIENKFYKIYIDAEHKYLGFPPGMYEVGGINNSLKTFSPEKSSGSDIAFDILANDITMKSFMTMHGT